MRVEAIAAIAKRRRCGLFVWYNDRAPLAWVIGIGDVMAGGGSPVEALGGCLLRLDGQWGPPTDPTEPIDREALAWLAW